MKNKILSVIAAAVCLVACDLNYTPLSKLSPETFFSTESELQAFSNQFYTDLTIGGFDEISDMLTKNQLTDEIIGNRSVPNSGGGWSFTALRNYNTLIEYSVNCPDEKVRTQYVALARFFRANFYFEKVKRFGDVPYYDKQLGSEDPALYNPRDSRELVMDKVIEDLDFAIANLSDKKDVYRITKWTALALKSRACLFEGTFRKYHAGKSTLETLPADAKPYTYYLELSADASEEIMNTSGYSIYRGSSKYTAYRDLFLGKTEPAELGNAYEEEIILARDYNQALNILHNATFFTIGNYGNQSMTRKMACTYLMADGTRYTDQQGWETKSFAEETKNRDPRMEQSIRIPGYKRIDGTEELAPNFTQVITGYQPIKYMLGLNADCDRYSVSYQDLHIYRYAEILLNYAEAKAELGTITQSDVDRSIKLLRDRVGMPNLNVAEAKANPDPYLQAAATGYPNVAGDPMEGVILEIRRERSVELFDEDVRHTDLIRWRNCQAYNHKFLGFYVANAEGQHDLDGNGTIDVWFYSGPAPEANTIPTGCVIRKINEQAYFTNGTSGYIVGNPHVDGNWDDEKDYYYPVPINERSLNPNLTQNKNWDDGLGK